MKKRVLLLLIALIVLGVFFYKTLNSDGYRLFRKPDVGGHGHGYLYFDNGLWTRRVYVGYEVESSLWDAYLSPDGSQIAFKKDVVLIVCSSRSSYVIMGFETETAIVGRPK